MPKYSHNERMKLERAERAERRARLDRDAAAKRARLAEPGPSDAHDVVARTRTAENDQERAVASQQQTSQNAGDVDVLFDHDADDAMSDRFSYLLSFDDERGTHERRLVLARSETRQLVATTCAGPSGFTAASDVIYSTHAGGATAAERSEHARKEVNSYWNRERYNWKNANIIGVRAGWGGGKSEGVKGVAWCHATKAAPKWLQKHCGTDPETPAPLPLYLYKRDGQSECLHLKIDQIAGSAQARFTFEGVPKPRYQSRSNLFEDGVLVFHQFTENEENPVRRR